MNLSQAYGRDGKVKDNLPMHAPVHHLADLINAISNWKRLPVDPKLLADQEPSNSAAGLPRKIIIAIKRASRPLYLSEVRAALPGFVFSMPRIKVALWRLMERGDVWCIGKRPKLRYGVGPKPEGARAKEERT